MKPLIIENSSATEATGLEPVYRVSGATEMVNVRCEPWSQQRPVECLPAILAAKSRLRPGEPLCAKLTWWGNRTMDAVNAAETPAWRPDEATIIDSYRTGVCNYRRQDESGESDLSVLVPLGDEFVRQAIQLDVLHINNECGNGFWSFTEEPVLPANATPDQLTKLEYIRTANGRNRAIMHAVLRDDRCRAALAPSLQSIPKDPAAIDEACQMFGPQRDQFEARQRDWQLRWNKIKLATLRAALVKSRVIGVQTRVYVSFSGAWRQWVCDSNGHECAPCQMPQQFYGNWQCYGPRPWDRLQAAAMASTPGTLLTFAADNDPETLRGYLRAAAPAGAFLYCPGGIAQAELHAEVIREYTEGN